ncbi:hypothetical protein HUB98_00830 [Paenibacillus barcinonensis]|uniref:Uncharacterized protein n=1 Tax=Paenibacillus barcinonensis TaxID=198119 RepID=A0ABX6PYJ3_PAEBA|nr:hypothetical protein [Paenibacillus barcinonensis]QKS54999.1 hypothetical protein HUB98_00830 [Paenibacillus barcinonensis]
MDKDIVIALKFSKTLFEGSGVFFLGNGKNAGYNPTKNPRTQRGNIGFTSLIKLLFGYSIVKYI